MNESLINQAEQLLTQCNVCTVASISKQGYPRICVLMPIEAKGIKEFWFSTGTNGTKVKHFENSCKSGVTFYNGGDSVTITGNMEIVTDKATKDRLFDKRRDFLGRHLPNGGKEDPNYCILHFSAKETTVYIDGKFETFEI